MNLNNIVELVVRMNENEGFTEEKENGFYFFKLFVNAIMVCGARTAGYSILTSITTTKGEERKGYAKRMLFHIEELARNDGATKMQTTNIDPCNYEMVCLMKSMRYELKHIEGDGGGFLEGEKSF